MGLFSFLGVHSPVHITAVTLFSGSKRIGIDEFGNKYYRAKPRKGYKHERRWVIYKGAPEASKVPPEWHGWLHHQTDVIPSETAFSFRRPWQKPHQPNLTGTNKAYKPSNDDKNDSDHYEAWQPSE
ncbi:MAG: NADH:ubiquinone oxidoreductase subunit NDUFA12 [Micavibrio sp.]|nr:NADH:ubiquinone oxidoreductase subunit NDUFA12 [Micavibrio sp.]